MCLNQFFFGQGNTGRTDYTVSCIDHAWRHIHDNGTLDADECVCVCVYGVSLSTCGAVLLRRRRNDRVSSAVAGISLQAWAFPHVACPVTSENNASPFGAVRCNKRTGSAKGRIVTTEVWEVFRLVFGRRIATAPSEIHGPVLQQKVTGKLLLAAKRTNKLEWFVTGDDF